MSSLSNRLGAEFYELPPMEMAIRLLGKQLVHQTPSARLAGLIVEVEAYLSENDLASHSAIGRTNRNRTMFEAPGHLYVYTIHTHHCMNIVCSPIGVGAAILIRALQPTQGIDFIKSNRGVADENQLTNGPGKLCRALGIDRSFDGCNLITSSQVWVEDVGLRDLGIGVSRRIGISRSAELLSRFFVDGNVFVSGRASDHSVKRINRIEI